MTVTITLNGTDTNPYEQYGLTQNPFPAIPEYGFSGANKLLANLAAISIKDVQDLRERLKGCSAEFIEGCVARFRPGEMVRFVINFPE